ncbi:MarR family winged helix-turn-helix transcriptional regulator [Streptomyces violascens]|uniref:MarR family winged helix-turn-helix transcriptional regulator n=1 Tax=Streptomyces violascens TaxID=67381 RepID=UPI0037A5325D
MARMARKTRTTESALDQAPAAAAGAGGELEAALPAPSADGPGVASPALAAASVSAADGPEPSALPPLQHIQSLPSWLIGRVAARGRGLVAEALAEQGVRMMHHAVLAAVSELGPIAQADLGRKLAIDPKDLVGILNDLQADGLTVREPDPRDRRKNAVTVTPAGQDLVERCAAAAETANAQLLAPLAPAEARRLMALLARLHEA